VFRFKSEPGCLYLGYPLICELVVKCIVWALHLVVVVFVVVVSLLLLLVCWFVVCVIRGVPFVGMIVGWSDARVVSEVVRT